MTDRKLTLFELHLHDATFNATKGIPSLGGDEAADDESDEVEDEEAGGGPGRRRGGELLGVLLLLVLLAAVARALMGKDGAIEELEDLDEVEDLVD